MTALYLICQNMETLISAGWGSQRGSYQMRVGTSHKYVLMDSHHGLSIRQLHINWSVT